MTEENKYERLPTNMLPQVKEQIQQRIEALTNVVKTQQEALEKSLQGVKDQLEEAENDHEWQYKARVSDKVLRKLARKVR